MIKSQLSKILSPTSLHKTPNKDNSIDDKYGNNHEKQNSKQQPKIPIENNKQLTPNKVNNLLYRIYDKDQNSRLNKTTNGRLNINTISKQKEQEQDSRILVNKNENNSELKYEQAQVNNKKQQKIRMNSTLMSKIKQMGDIVTSISSKYNYTPKMGKNTYMDLSTNVENKQMKKTQQNSIKLHPKQNTINNAHRYNKQNRYIKSLNKTLYDITNKQVQSKIITQQSQHLQQSNYQPNNDEQQSGYAQSARRHYQKQKETKINKYLNDSTMNYTQLLDHNDLQFSFEHNDSKSNCRDRSSSRFKIKERQAEHKLQAQNIDNMHMQIHGLLSHIKLENSKDKSHKKSTKQEQNQQKYNYKNQNKAYSKTSKIDIMGISKSKLQQYNYLDDIKMSQKHPKIQLFKQDLSLKESNCDKQIHADLVKKYKEKIEKKENKSIQPKFKYYYNSKDQTRRNQHKYCYDSKHSPEPKQIKTKTKQPQCRKESSQKRIIYGNVFNNSNFAKQTRQQLPKYQQPVESQVRQFRQQEDTGYGNMEYVDLINSQIARIKQRIQNSEKLTKKMQNKYLNTQKIMLNTINRDQFDAQLKTPHQNTDYYNQKYLQSKLDRITQQEQAYDQQIMNKINIQRWRKCNLDDTNEYYDKPTRIINNNVYIQSAKGDKCLTPQPQYQNSDRSHLEETHNTQNKNRKASINPFRNDFLLANSTQIIDEDKSIFTKQAQNTTKTANGYRSRNQISCRLASILIQQVSIDQKLRQYRQMFYHLSIKEETRKPGKCISRQSKQQQKQQKWVLLQHRLMELNYEYSETQLQAELQINPGQTDPFYSHRPEPTCNSKIIINKLAQLFVKSQQYWANHVVGCLQQYQQIQNSFQIYTLDLSQKGYISMEDIVCFINLYTGKHYRNRDVAALFRRFTQSKENRASYQAIEEVLYKFT